MILNYVPRLNQSGYRIMEELADTVPHLFLQGDSKQLKESFDYLAAEKGERPYDYPDIKLRVPLDPLNQIRRAGPKTDADYAPLLRQAVAGLSSEQAYDGCFWASLNCFVLSPYVSVRWKSHIKKLKPAQFVKRHWLWIGKQGRVWNAAARLWWLAENALRASEFSMHSSDTFLQTMANNVGLYHQMTARAFSSNPVLIAAIYDIALANNEYLFQTDNANELCKALNIKADTFDILDYEELHQIVINSLPFAPGATGLLR